MSEFTVTKCEKGFLLTAYELVHDRKRMWAFGTIEALAAFVVEKFTPEATP